MLVQIIKSASYTSIQTFVSKGRRWRWCVGYYNAPGMALADSEDVGAEQFTKTVTTTKSRVQIENIRRYLLLSTCGVALLLW